MTRKMIESVSPSELLGHETFDCWDSQVSHVRSLQWNKGYNDTTGHYKWQESDSDHGGPWDFYISKIRRVPSQRIHITAVPGAPNALRQAKLRLTAAAPWVPASSLATEADPNDWFAKAYSRLKPDRPSFEGLTALLELRDLPSLLKTRFELSLKSIGSNYLGYEFGIRPLISDIKDLLALQEKIDKRLDWLLRNHGKPVRTRAILANNTSTPTPWEFGGYAWNSFDQVFHFGYYESQTQPYHFRRHSGTRRIWASGRFRFWLPPMRVPPVRYRSKLKRALYGANFNLRTIYNLIPWSWLIDWFSNLGDIVSSVSIDIADRVSADYVYLMIEDTVSEEISAVGRFNKYTGNTSTAIEHVDARTYRDTSRKRRFQGTTFGFNILDSSLDSRQLAILGALGLSRL